MNYYRNENGEIGVLISKGFGAGWSTWNQAEIAYDKRVVEYFLEHYNDANWMNKIGSRHTNDVQDEFIRLLQTWGYDSVYIRGFVDCELYFVPSGTPFRIEEYDGSESLTIGTDTFTILY